MALRFVTLVFILLCNSVVAQPANMRLELNRLEAREGSCRFWVVANSTMAENLDLLRLDLVLFGRDGVILRRLAVDVGPMLAGRTVVRIFDVANQPCEGIGQLLINDLLACGGTDPAQRAACTDRLMLASRVEGVTFQK